MTKENEIEISRSVCKHKEVRACFSKGLMVSWGLEEYWGRGGREVSRSKKVVIAVTGGG